LPPGAVAVDLETGVEVDPDNPEDDLPPPKPPTQ
jgi:hypothetical protein